MHCLGSSHEAIEHFPKERRKLSWIKNKAAKERGRKRVKSSLHGQMATVYGRHGTIEQQQCMKVILITYFVTHTWLFPRVKAFDTTRGTLVEQIEWFSKV